VRAVRVVAADPAIDQSVARSLYRRGGLFTVSYSRGIRYIPCKKMFLWIFAVFCCGSLELLGWLRIAGGYPLVCTADPLMHRAHCNPHSFMTLETTSTSIIVTCMRFNKTSVTLRIPRSHARAQKPGNHARTHHLS
jgi:hypothetical protein